VIKGDPDSAFSCFVVAVCRHADLCTTNEVTGSPAKPGNSSSILSHARAGSMFGLNHNTLLGSYFFLSSSYRGDSRGTPRRNQ